jgi:hypothetical protein
MVPPMSYCGAEERPYFLTTGGFYMAEVKLTTLL